MEEHVLQVNIDSVLQETWLISRRETEKKGKKYN